MMAANTGAFGGRTNICFTERQESPAESDKTSALCFRGN
jgi:hypothetical protein